MSAYDDPVGKFVSIDGFMARIETADDTGTLFLRFDESSSPGHVPEAAVHFQQRKDAGQPFDAVSLWAANSSVLVTAVRWDEERQVLRIKLERSNPPGQKKRSQ